MGAPNKIINGYDAGLLLPVVSHTASPQPTNHQDTWFGFSAGIARGDREPTDTPRPQHGLALSRFITTRNPVIRFLEAAFGLQCLSI